MYKICNLELEIEFGGLLRCLRGYDAGTCPLHTTRVEEFFMSQRAKWDKVEASPDDRHRVTVLDNAKMGGTDPIERISWNLSWHAILSLIGE